MAQQQQPPQQPPPANSSQVQQLSACLLALTQPDTATIRQAEQQLKPVLKQPETMAVLWQVCVAQDQPVAARHVAAIVLRKRLPAHYSNWPPSTKLQWQQQVLQQIAVEQVRPVQTGLVAVAAALQQVDQQATPPVLEFLQAAVSNPSPTAQELGFLLLQEMTDTIGLHWKEHLVALRDLFAAVLAANSKADVRVQKAAVKALGQLLSFWADDPEIEGLAPLLPVLLQVAASTAGSDEDFLSTVLDVLYDLAYSPAPSLQPHLTVTVQFALQCLSNRNLELAVRDAAALVIATTAEAKPKSFGRHTELMGAVLDTLFQLMQSSSKSAAGALFESNPAWRADLEGEALDEDDLDAPTETSMAQGTLDMIACEVPKKYIWQPVLTRCLERMNDKENAAARKAGVAGLGVIAEGCAEPLRETLGQVLPYVFAAAGDADAQVRECACFCLGQMSEHCQPDILQYSSQILPIVFKLLDDNSVAVQATSCYVLEMFCERLEPDAVRPLLDSLVRKLAGMLEATTKRSVQEMAVAALAATAVAAEDEFAQYVPGVATLMSKLMQLQDPNMYSLRGRALECMGHMAIAVGRDNFRPYFAVTMQSAMEGLTTDSTDLQEFAYAVFANLAKVMKEEFAPALPDLVPHLVKVIEMDEGQFEQQEDTGEDFGGLDDSDDEDNEGNLVLRVRTALLEVKKGAITALGEMAAHCGGGFCPYLEASMQILQRAAGNWHPLIKCEVADAFPSLIVPTIAAYQNGEIQWTKGDLDSPNPMHAHTNAIVEAVLIELIAMQKDDEKQTVGKACESIQSVIELCGPHALAPVAQEIMSNTHELLSRTSPCHAVDAMYGEVPDDDDDHDIVMSASCDLVGSFGRVMGARFAPFLPQFLPLICEYCKSSRPPSDRSMAMGCLSEIADELGPGMGDHWTSVFLPAILAGLADPDDNVKRNSAVCAGLCCEKLKERVVGDYPAILQPLGQLFTLADSSTNGDGLGMSDARAAAIDNAAGAVARMIMAAPNSVPLPQVLPVFLRALPLLTDMTENETVYTCLIGLMQMRHPDLMANMAEVKRICTAVCQGESSQKVDEQIRQKLQQAMQALEQQQ